MRVCVAFTWETHACVLMEGEKETHFYSSTGLTFTSGNINQLQEITAGAKCYLAAGRSSGENQRSSAPPLTKSSASGNPNKLCHLEGIFRHLHRRGCPPASDQVRLFVSSRSSCACEVKIFLTQYNHQGTIWQTGGKLFILILFVV